MRVELERRADERQLVASSTPEDRVVVGARIVTSQHQSSGRSGRPGPPSVDPALQDARLQREEMEVSCQATGEGRPAKTTGR